jgi:hypothetical protein
MESMKLTKKYSMSKKGSAGDLFYIVISFFAVCIIGILVSAVVTKFNTQFQKITANGIITSDAYNAGNTLANTMPATLNVGMLFFFFAACIVALIFASLTPFHPVFFVFFILELILLIFISGGIANSFQAFIETPALATEHGQYTTIIFLFHYLPFIIGVVGFILAGVMYKVKTAQEGF